MIVDKVSESLHRSPSEDVFDDDEDPMDGSDVDMTDDEELEDDERGDLMTLD